MLELFEYHLPFHSPFKTGASTYENRQGILLHYKKNEIDLVTEASPLPGFSAETLADVRKVLMDQKSFINEFLGSSFTLREIRSLEKNEELQAPSVQFALSFLALLVLAERKNKTIYDLFKSIPAENLLVNDVISHSAAREIMHRIERSVQKGFKVIKVKAPEPVEELASMLSDVQKKYPGLTFRLDASQSWTESAITQNCELFRDIKIEYIEEPFRVNSPDEIRKLQQKCPIPVALDESVLNLSTLQLILETVPDVYIIIKPMILGNILKIHETISLFRSSFKRIVCTTALESGIGRSMVATTAVLAGDLNLSHGLNTGQLFSADLLPGYDIKNGLLKNIQKNTGYKSFRHIKTSYLIKLG